MVALSLVILAFSVVKSCRCAMVNCGLGGLERDVAWQDRAGNGRANMNKILYLYHPARHQTLSQVPILSLSHPASPNQSSPLFTILAIPTYPKLKSKVEMLIKFESLLSKIVTESTNISQPKPPILLTLH